MGFLKSGYKVGHKSPVCLYQGQYSNVDPIGPSVYWFSCVERAIDLEHSFGQRRSRSDTKGKICL